MWLAFEEGTKSYACLRMTGLALGGAFDVRVPTIRGGGSGRTFNLVPKSRRRPTIGEDGREIILFGSGQTEYFAYSYEGSGPTPETGLTVEVAGNSFNDKLLPLVVELKSNKAEEKMPAECRVN